jgi:Spy/CpxP family protein refolding chaperone
MVRTTVGRLVCWMTLVSLAVVFATVEQPVLRADGPVKKALAKRGRRLPKYYDQITTTPEQQKAIQKIQDEYDPKIDELDAKLKALKKERKDKIDAVLTPAQKKQIEDAKDKDKENKAKEKAAKAAASKPAEKTPATPPAEQTPN